MSGMLNVLLLLCGLDYSQEQYKQCITKTKTCYESNASKLPVKKTEGAFTEAEKAVFYKCYSEGAVGKTKQMKR